MEHESYKNMLTVEKTDKTFSKCVNEPDISPSIQKQMSNANLLILPIDGVKNNELFFPEGTYELYLYLKDHAYDGLIPEICIDDDKFEELAVHGDIINIGYFIVTNIFARIAVKLIYEYLKDLLGPKNIDTHIKFDLTIEKKGESTHIIYEGPSNDLCDNVLPEVKKLQ